MNNSTDNIHTVSGVAQNKKVCAGVLGRGVRSKSKLRSPPQADHNWKPTNAFSTRLGKQMGATHSIYTGIGPKHWDLRMSTSLHSMEKSRNWFGRKSSIILILLELPLLSVVAPILLSGMTAGSFSTQVKMYPAQAG